MRKPPELTQFGIVLREVFRVVRWLLVGYLVAAVMAAIWLAPRPAGGEGSYAADLSAGRVEWVARGELDPVKALGVFAGEPETNGITWSVGNGFGDVRYLGVLSDGDADRLLDEARAKGIDTVPPDTFARRLTENLPAVWLLAVLVLIAGPQPRRATKWAWYWLFSLPAYLGVLAWIVLDAPWSRAAMARPDPGPGGRFLQPEDRRLRAGRAFILGILGSMLLAGLHQWALNYLG